MYRHIKARMIVLGISGKQMAAMLRDEGMTCSTQDVSRALSNDRHYSDFPKMEKMREKMQLIMDRIEKKEAK